MALVCFELLFFLSESCKADLHSRLLVILTCIKLGSFSCSYSWLVNFCFLVIPESPCVFKTNFQLLPFVYGLKTEKAGPAAISFPSQLKGWEGPGNYQNQTLPDLCSFYNNFFTCPVSFLGSINRQPANAIMRYKLRVQKASFCRSDTQVLASTILPSWVALRRQLWLFPKYQRPLDLSAYKWLGTNITAELEVN